MKAWVPEVDKHRTITQIGCIAPPSRPAVHDNSLVNCERALKERVYFVKSGDGFSPPPKPIHGAFDRCQKFRRELSRYMPKIPSLTWDDFPKRYKDARKRRIYQNAVDTLLLKPLCEDDGLVKGFVKDERLNLDVKLDSVPRAILPLSPRLNVVEGSINAHREHAMFEAIDKLFGKKTVMKGLNASERGRIIAGKWHSFADPVAVGMDASRWDQHVSLPMLLFQNSCFMDHCCTKQERRALGWCLEQAKNGKGIMRATDGRIKFSREGGRLSGTMHTSSGNVMCMCALFYTYMRKFTVKWDYINDGDDCVLFLERKDLRKVLPGISAWFLEMGVNMVIEKPVRDLEKVEFCQSRPVWTPEGYIMTRNPRTAPVKDAMCLKPMTNEKEWGSWIRSVGECGMSLTGGVPLFQAFYSVYIRSSTQYSVNKLHKADGGLKLASVGMHRRHQEVHEMTRYSFAIAWDIDPTTQVAIEREWDNHHLAFSKFVKLDVPLSSPLYY